MIEDGKHIPNGFCHPGRINGPVCGLFAVAQLTGVKFEEVRETYRIISGVGRRWKGSTFMDFLYRTMDVLEFQHVSLTPYRWQPIKSDGQPRNPRLSTLARDFCIPGVKYMVRVRGHIVTVKDYFVMDQCNLQPADKVWCKNKIVTEVIVSLEDSEKYYETDSE